MFGSYRFLLAHMVVLGHLWPEHGFDTHVYAVFCFYLLSGYLMTLVLKHRYGFAPRGTLRFLANRALRIYPPYAVVLGAGIGIALLMPESAFHTNPYLRLPTTAIGWLHNVFILGLSGDTARLVPPAWSLDVELFFYLGLGLLLARRRSIVVVWFAASVAYTVVLVARDTPFPDRYISYAAASLPFSAGALLYHARELLPAARPAIAVAATGLYLGHALAAPWIWEEPRTTGFYVSLALGALAIAALARVRSHDLPGPIGRVDRWLGDLSYPIFLCHWAVAVVVVSFGVELPWRESGVVYAVVALLVNPIALGLHLGVERPLEALRERIRHRAD